jgi:hypothetical protein
MKLLRPLAGYTLYEHKTKRLHTPQTTDHKPIRQDRRIQTELASTLAKNATKSNPFEIIPLQTTGKKNNWKTGETLARAAVTLETGGSKCPILDVYDDDDRALLLLNIYNCTNL